MNSKVKYNLTPPTFLSSPPFNTFVCFSPRSQTFRHDLATEQHQPLISTFLSQPKLTPTSGPLHLMFSLPGLCLPQILGSLAPQYISIFIVFLTLQVLTDLPIQITSSHWVLPVLIPWLIFFLGTTSIRCFYIVTVSPFRQQQYLKCNLQNLQLVSFLYHCIPSYTLEFNILSTQQIFVKLMN